MRAAGHHTAGAVLDDGVGGIDDRPRRIDHVVGQQYITTRHIADDMQHLRHVLALAAFIDDP